VTGPVSPLPETSPNWTASARRRLIFYLFAAILLAALAGILTFVYLDRLRAASLPSNPAVVALVDIAPGDTIDETMVAVEPLPENALPAGYLTGVSQAVGRVAAVPIAAREVLLPSRFVGGGGEGLSGRLPDGRWAMILPVGWLISGTPELIEGDRLEIMAYQAGQPEDQAGVIVTAVEVLSISGPADNPDRLTLAVDLDQARTLLYSRVNGFSMLGLLRPAGSPP
jgi:Flp pilus assembly protein CpaB